MANALHDMPSYVNGVFGLGPFISLVVRWIYFELWDGFTQSIVSNENPTTIF
jgi:hypothetical protein